MKKQEYTKPQIEVITMSVNGSLLMSISGEGGSVGNGSQWARRRRGPKHNSGDSYWDEEWDDDEYDKIH